jgi:hypothetical protein
MTTTATLIYLSPTRGFLFLHKTRTRSTETTGLEVSLASSQASWSTTRPNPNPASAGDYNNDGKLDLFVANVGTNFLYRNDGDGVFTKIITGDIVNDVGNFAGGAWGDYNNDGFLDLFVANLGSVAPVTNFLYRNTGAGTFAKVTSGAIVTNTANFTASTWGDYDNDGFLDLFVCEYQPGNNFLYHNNGDGTFSRITTGSNRQRRG